MKTIAKLVGPSVHKELVQDGERYLHIEPGSNTKYEIDKITAKSRIWSWSNFSAMLQIRADLIIVDRIAVEALYIVLEDKK